MKSKNVIIQPGNQRALRTTMVGGAALLLLASACGARENDVEVSVAGINSQIGCFTTTADITFNGRGSVTTTSSYDHPNCRLAYLIDITDYAANLNAGSQVSEVGAPATTSSACDRTRITAYVWRRESNGTGTFLDSFERRGVWGPDIKGVNRCMAPTINLEKAIPAYVGDGQKDYRIAVQARLNDATGTGFTVHALAFAAVEAHARTPAGDMNDLDSYRFEFILPAGATHPNVQNLIDHKGTYAVDLLCRKTRLDRALSQFTNQALVRAGATSTATGNRDAAFDLMITGLCTSAGTVTTLQDGIFKYAGAMAAIRLSIQNTYPNQPDAAAFAANVMAQTNAEAIGLLIMRCGIQPSDVLAYLYDGTLPVGKTADNLLMAKCSGSTPASVALSLGVGLDFPGQTKAQARQTFNDCMVDNTGTDLCNDPRAADAAPESKDGDTPLRNDDHCWNWQEQRACNTDEQSAWDAEQAAKKQTATTVDAIAERAKGTDPAPNKAAVDMAKDIAVAGGDIALVADAAAKIGITDLAAAATLKVAEYVSLFVKGAVAGMVTCAQFPSFCDVVIGGPVRTVQAIAVAAGNELRQNPCMFAPNAGAGYCPRSTNQMCNPAYDVGGWYDTDRPGSSSEISKTDRFQHCMCQLLDSNYAGATSGLVPAGCPTAEEKLRQDCLTTPQGPDDKPRPECLRQLSPPGDLHTWQTRICDKVKCFPGLVMKTTDDGSCNCVATPMPDIGQGLPCRLGTVMLCDGSGVDESCGCPTFTRTGPGPVPIGNDPLCRYQTDDASWPGNLDGFTVLSPNDVFMHQHTATERFAMIKPNRTLISPTIYRNTVSAVPATGTSNPAKLRVKTLLTKAPPAGSNVTLQIYATSKDLPAGTQPLLNQLIGQASLNALTPGTPTNVDIALDQTLIDRAFSGGSFRLGYYISATGGGATRYVGVGSQQFIGNNTPLASPMPICPRPDPTNGLATIALYNPLSIATGGTPTVWAPYIISGVTLGLTPDRIQVVRSLTPVP